MRQGGTLKIQSELVDEWKSCTVEGWNPVGRFKSWAVEETPKKKSINHGMFTTVAKNWCTIFATIYYV